MWVRFTADGIPAWFGPAPVEGAERVEGVDEETLLTCRRVGGKWVAREPVVPAPPTPEEIEAAQAERLQASRQADAAARKLAGFEFDGVMCSATSADQAGLTAVFLAIQLRGQDFLPVRFEFENGSALVITEANHESFIARWLPFRQSFFRAAT